MTHLRYSNDCDDDGTISTSRSTTDTINQRSTGDNKSTVDGERSGNGDDGPTPTTEIAHFAEQLDNISNAEEGGDRDGETLNSITGGLQVSSPMYKLSTYKLHEILNHCHLIFCLIQLYFILYRSLKMLTW